MYLLTFLRQGYLAPDAWSVAGQGRVGSEGISLAGGTPAYGGTPSDKGVRAAFEELSLRGVAATFIPFILMDIPHENGKPSPDGAPSQPAYPWRGRITVPDAALLPSTPGRPQRATSLLIRSSGKLGYSGGK